MPVVCIDLVIEHKGKIVLVKRKTEPEKNCWWLPGGRIYKNETLDNAAKRKAREETGLATEIVKQLGVYEYVSDKSIFDGVGTHSIVVGYHLKATGEQEISIDQTSTDARWFNTIDDSLHNHVKTIINDANVFQ